MSLPENRKITLKNTLKNNIGLIIILSCLFAACSTTKSKDEQSKTKEFYHNLTSKYNGYFNAEELMERTIIQIDEMEDDNYNKVLPVYSYVGIDNPTVIAPDLDKAIDKVITVATIHDQSNYVDDCYVMLGKAQYLKQDYAAAEETFKFFEEEFDPKNPFGRAYQKAKNIKLSAKEKNKEREAEQKEKKKERAEINKEKEKTQAEERKARKEELKQREKDRRKKKKNKVKKYRSSSDNKETADKPKNDKTTISDEEKAALKAAKEQEQAAIDYAEQKAKLQEKLDQLKKDAEREQGEGGLFKNKTAFYRGLYWLARTYIETERFSSANYIFDRLATINPLEDDLARKLPAAKAHLLMKTGETGAALVELDEAISLEKDKRLKARYAFIKGQLYEQNNSPALAYTAYSQAKKYSPDYELKFNAELNEIKLSYKTGKISKDKVESKLNKLLSETKNEAFNDQIYFTMALVKLEAGEVDASVEDFENSIAASGGNKNVKLEAYYKLANILYDKEYYRKAKTNYDATIKAMSLTDNRYKNVEKRAKSLEDISRNLEVLELQDSLMRLSLMTDEELVEIAMKDLKAKGVASPDPSKPANRTSNLIRNNLQLGAGRSNFFAYNPTALNQGKIEFKRSWGDRVLEDNWRRSLRTDASGAIVEEEVEEEEEKEFTDQEISDYLREVPKSETQKRTAHLKIQKALFELGVQFRIKLKNYKKSTEVLERLVREFPDFSKRDEAIYYLYLNYQDLGKGTEATQAKNKLKTEYPDSKFTKIATDPAYALSLQNSVDNIESYYERTYKLFENNKFQAVLERVDEKSKLYSGKSDYDPKFNLLQAMSYGHVEGKEKYVKELRDLIKRHKGTPEAIRGQEILRFLNGDAEAFDEILYDESFDKFQTEDDKLHYCFVVIYDKSKRLQDIKIAMSDYNKKYHRTDKLTITNIALNPDSKSHIVLVRSFDNKEKAMAYYTGVQKNKEKYINKDSSKEQIGFDLFVATQRNYREVVKQRTVVSYREFFKLHYDSK